MRVRVRERMRAGPGPVFFAAVLAVIFGGDGAEAQTIQLEGSTPFYTNSETITIQVSLSEFTAGGTGTFSYSGNCFDTPYTVTLDSNGAATEDIVLGGLTDPATSSAVSSSCDITFTEDTSGAHASVGSFSIIKDEMLPTSQITRHIQSDTNNNVPTFEVTVSEEGSITLGSSCPSGSSVGAFAQTSTVSVTGAGYTGTYTITVGSASSPLPDGSYSPSTDPCEVTFADLADNVAVLPSPQPQKLDPFTVDTAPPTIFITTQISSPTTDSTPSYSVTVSEAGTVSFSGSCGASAPASLGGNGLFILTMGTLTDGTYADCGVSFTDLAGNAASNGAQSLTSFTVDATAPTISIFAQISSPTTDNMPQYTVDVSEAGTASFSGSCAASTPTSLDSGNNVLTMGTLSDGTYADCKVSFEDTAGNAASSGAQSLTSFTVDTVVPTISIKNQVTTPTSDTTPQYTVTVSEAGTASFSGSCAASTPTSLSSDDNVLTMGTLSAGTYADCTVSFADTAGNAASSGAQSLTSFTVDTVDPTLFVSQQVVTPNNDVTPSFKITVSEAGTATYGGSCSSATPTSIGSGGEHPITVQSTLTEGTYSDCTVSFVDGAGQSAGGALTLTAFTVDTTVPTLELRHEVEPTNPESATDGSFHIYVSEAGTATFVNCPVVSTTEQYTSAGEKTVPLSGMSDGTTYSTASAKCTVSFEDSAGNPAASIVELAEFQVIFPATISISTQSSVSSPYTSATLTNFFTASSSRAGTMSITGCMDDGDDTLELVDVTSSDTSAPVGTITGGGANNHISAVAKRNGGDFTGAAVFKHCHFYVTAPAGSGRTWSVHEDLDDFTVDVAPPDLTFVIAESQTSSAAAPAGFTLTDPGEKITGLALSDCHVGGLSVTLSTLTELVVHGGSNHVIYFDYSEIAVIFSSEGYPDFVLFTDCKVTGYDENGNFAESTLGAFRIDNTLPVLAVTNPTGTTNGMPQFEATVTEAVPSGSGFKVGTFTIAGSSSNGHLCANFNFVPLFTQTQTGTLDGSIVSGLPANDFVYDFSSTTSYQQTIVLGATAQIVGDTREDFTCTVVFTDNAGNDGTPVTVSFVVDREFPTLTVDSWDPGAYVADSDASTPAVDEVEFSISASEDGNVVFSDACSSIATVSVTANIVNDITWQLDSGDGTYTNCKITLTDTAGNAVVQQLPDFTYDNTASGFSLTYLPATVEVLQPTVTVTTSEPGRIRLLCGTFQIWGTVTQTQPGTSVVTLNEDYLGASASFTDGAMYSNCEFTFVDRAENFDGSVISNVPSNVVVDTCHSKADDCRGCLDLGGPVDLQNNAGGCAYDTASGACSTCAGITTSQECNINANGCTWVFGSGCTNKVDATCDCEADTQLNGNQCACIGVHECGWSGSTCHTCTELPDEACESTKCCDLVDGSCQPATCAESDYPSTCAPTPPPTVRPACSTFQSFADPKLECESASYCGYHAEENDAHHCKECTDLETEDGCKDYDCCEWTNPGGPGTCGGGVCPPTPPPPPPSPPPTEPPGDESTGDGGGGDDETMILVGAVVGGLLIVGLIIWVSVHASKSNRSKYEEIPSDQSGDLYDNDNDNEDLYDGGNWLYSRVSSESRSEALRRVGELTY